MSPSSLVPCFAFSPPLHSAPPLSACEQRLPAHTTFYQGCVCRDPWQLVRSLPKSGTVTQASSSPPTLHPFLRLSPNQCQERAQPKLFLGPNFPLNSFPQCPFPLCCAKKNCLNISTLGGKKLKTFSECLLNSYCDGHKRNSGLLRAAGHGGPGTVLMFTNRRKGVLSWRRKGFRWHQRGMLWMTQGGLK